MNAEKTSSPFQKPGARRISFGTMMILLLMVVSAGVGILIFNAMRVPAITTEINAWLGRPDATVDRVAARQAQLIFALFLYTAPLGLGMLVYFLHFAVNWFDRMSRPVEDKSEDQFRME